MKKYLFTAVLLLCSANSWALNVGQVLSPIQSNQQPQRDLAIQYWTGVLEMAMLINAQLSQSGKPLFCLPTPAPNIQQIFEFFTKDAETMVKAQGMEKAASMAVPDVMLRTLISRYGKCK